MLILLEYSHLRPSVLSNTPQILMRLVVSYKESCTCDLWKVIAIFVFISSSLILIIILQTICPAASGQRKEKLRFCVGSNFSTSTPLLKVENLQKVAFFHNFELKMFQNKKWLMSFSKSVWALESAVGRWRVREFCFLT